MSAIDDCAVCGDTLCQKAHDCRGCLGEAAKQCDREHLTCDDCAYTVGEGPDVVVRCGACVQEDIRAEDEPDCRDEVRP